MSNKWKAIGLHDDATAEVGQTIRVKAVDENNLPIEWETASAQPDWSQNDDTQPDFVKNRTHWVTIDYTDTLTWDGNYEGKVIVGDMLCKVSDIVLTMNELSAGCDMTLSTGESATISGDSIVAIADGCLFIEELFTVFVSDAAVNVDLDGLIFPEPGIYFAIPEVLGGLYISSMTVSGVNSFISKIYKQLDVGYIPDSIQRKLTGSDSQFVGFDENGNAVAFDPELVGKNVTDTEYTIDDAAVTADIGAEIFNNYRENKASGRYSHAEGSSTTASGAFSHAEGYNTTASGDTSHAEGSSTTASGSMSHAEGAHTTASGQCSHAEGNATTASGLGSHVEGVNSEAIGSYSHAEGQGTTASGNMSHAEGLTTEASGEYSHAEGWNAKATNECSHAEGYSTTASGKYSHAEGYSTTASGKYSHAEGYSTTASGQYSHAEGDSTTASGMYSHAEGNGTTAQRANQHVQGRYNVLDIEGDSETAAGKYIHIVGNGAHSNKRSNAHTLDWDGNAWFAGDVYVGSTSGTNKDDGSVKLATEEYVDTQIASIPTPDVSGQISAHNTSKDAHGDIRNAIPTKTSELTNDSGFMTGYTETDPTVPAWAKTPSKPIYTASEVGARPNTWVPSLTDIGVTATADELNYVDGVTSNIQEQLNGKAASSHGNHVPTTQTANNAVFLRNDNTWQTVTPANIGAAASSHNQAASTITDGTLAGQVVANATAVATIGTAQVRNIYAGTDDMTAGSTALATGTLYFVYE